RRHRGPSHPLRSRYRVAAGRDGGGRRRRGGGGLAGPAGRGRGPGRSPGGAGQPGPVPAARPVGGGGGPGAPGARRGHRRDRPRVQPRPRCTPADRPGHAAPGYRPGPRHPGGLVAHEVGQRVVRDGGHPHARPAGGAMRLAVVGGGIAGLAAALRLRDLLGPAARITVYEQAATPGGKLRTGTLAGLVAERGAESFLVRSPDGAGDSAAVALARRVGLGDDLVHPRPLPAALWLDGGLQPIPPGTLLGVPGDLSRLAGVAAVADHDHDTGQPLLGPDEDVAVGALVRRRLGDEVVDRLVDPVLGGVYAGRADSLSLSATMP